MGKVTTNSKIKAKTNVRTEEGNKRTNGRRKNAKGNAFSPLYFVPPKIPSRFVRCRKLTFFLLRVFSIVFSFSLPFSRILFVYMLLLLLVFLFCFFPIFFLCIILLCRMFTGYVDFLKFHLFYSFTYLCVYF